MSGQSNPPPDRPSELKRYVLSGRPDENTIEKLLKQFNEEYTLSDDDKYEYDQRIAYLWLTYRATKDKCSRKSAMEEVSDIVSALAEDDSDAFEIEFEYLYQLEGRIARKLASDFYKINCDSISDTSKLKAIRHLIRVSKNNAATGTKIAKLFILDNDSANVNLEKFTPLYDKRGRMGSVERPLSLALRTNSACKGYENYIVPKLAVLECVKYFGSGSIDHIFVSAKFIDIIDHKGAESFKDFIWLFYKRFGAHMRADCTKNYYLWLEKHDNERIGLFKEYFRENVVPVLYDTENEDNGIFYDAAELVAHLWLFYKSGGNVEVSWQKYIEMGIDDEFNNQCIKECMKTPNDDTVNRIKERFTNKGARPEKRPRTGSAGKEEIAPKRLGVPPSPMNCEACGKRETPRPITHYIDMGDDVVRDRGEYIHQIIEKRIVSVESFGVDLNSIEDVVQYVNAEVLEDPDQWDSFTTSTGPVHRILENAYTIYAIVHGSESTYKFTDDDANMLATIICNDKCHIDTVDIRSAHLTRAGVKVIIEAFKNKSYSYSVYVSNDT